MHWAKNADVAGFLLEVGANVNAVANEGDTPLHKAAGRWADIGVAALLLDNGAEVKVKNKYGATPLHVAARYGREDVAELLIARGAEVNAQDWGIRPSQPTGKTPLDWAVGGGYKDIAELLKKHGANGEQ